MVGYAVAFDVGIKASYHDRLLSSLIWCFQRALKIGSMWDNF
jgi:hypothetical protein